MSPNGHARQAKGFFGPTGLNSIAQLAGLGPQKLRICGLKVRDPVG